MRSRPFALLAAATAILAVLAGAAHASEIVDRDATHVRLWVNAKGEALVSYQAGGRVKHVLVWGAVDALPPALGRRQVAFKKDYAGGWGKYHTLYWKTFPHTCARYTGPKLAWFVTGCTAPDGSYWALQSWQRALPDYGVPPAGARAVWELHLSHFTVTPQTGVPVLEIATDWGYHGRWDHLYGTYVYGGEPVYGFRSTHAGVPLDPFGRNVYVDTFDSGYPGGHGRWLRENSFLAHGPLGDFCYLLGGHGAHPSGKGTEYRATAIGPGVAPDAFWQGPAPGPYREVADAQANDVQAAWHDPACKAN